MTPSQQAETKRLSEVPPDRFVAERDALVKELRAAGKDGEAKRVAALRKPSTALWVVNRLAKIAPDDVQALIEATAQVKRAQMQGRGDELRDAMRAQREALQRLTDAAGRAALEIGTQPSLSLQRRVQTTVQSAATAEPDALREGTLEHELEATGFEGLAGAKPAAVRPQKETAGERRSAEERKNEQASLAKEIRNAQEAARHFTSRARAAHRQAARAAETAEVARGRAQQAQRAADEAAARVLELKRKS